MEENKLVVDEVAEGSASYGPAMAKLTEKQRRYVLAMAADPLGNPTRWVKIAGYERSTDGGFRVAAFRLAHDKRIEAAAREVAQMHLNTFGPLLGIGVMIRIARDKNHPKQLAAAEALADRTGFHATQEVRVSGEVVVNHTDAALEQLRIFRDLGVPREKLVELFGFSGLSRYERMLEEADGKRPMKVIEHKGMAE